MSSSDSKAEDPTTKVYAPSRSVTYDDNKKYRLTAGAAVLNSQGHLLVGERISIANAWQAPQGGVDDAWEENNFQAETSTQAATRELYEEMGLQLNKHVVLAAPFNNNKNNNPNDDECAKTNGIRYETTGTSSWLSKSGFSGQELHWVVFRCVDGRGDSDPNEICNLEGQNGEDAEFRQVAWRPIQQVIDDIWAPKRGPYEALESLVEQSQSAWVQQCHDEIGSFFKGTWERDNSMSENLVEALQARGMSLEKAKQSAQGPYEQTWTVAPSEEKPAEQQKMTEWKVTTYAADGVTARRTLLYPIGEWEETYKGESTLFGDSSSLADDEPATLKRRTFYAPEILVVADSGTKTVAAHVTITITPKGDMEESRRYRDGDIFVLKRTFWSKEETNDDNNSAGIVSKEFFRRC